MKYYSFIVVCVLLLQFSCRNKASKTSGILPLVVENIAAEKSSGYQGEFLDQLKVQEDALNFLVIGDWGRNGEYHQVSVARQMANAAITMDAEFVISTGDNFYPNGVASTSDPLWRTSFEDVYSAYALQNPWNVVLGNHDYKSNPEAQIAYSAISSRWNLPNHYYSKKVSINEDTTQRVLFVYLDTNPFVKKYYHEEEYQSNVSKQDTSAQLSWLNKVLGDTDPGIKWKVVVGHHPLYCGGKRAKSPETYDVRKVFEPIFVRHHVDAYLCGHEHDLQHIKPPGNTHHFVSGAGCEIRPTGKIPGTRFAKADYGFMAFSVTSSNLLVQVLNDRGNIIYTENINK